MAWHPIGPDFVFAPRIVPWKRLSPMNERGRQGTVMRITVDPTDPLIVYIIERPQTGGATAFRSDDAGRSWTPIVDDLQRQNFRVDPDWIAVNPTFPQRIYLGTSEESALHFSDTRGATWSGRVALPGRVRVIVVDPRTSAAPATTVLCVGTTGGIFVSPNDGAAWPLNPVAGRVWSMVVNPKGGSPLAGVYAGVRGTGIWRATNPAVDTSWSNLNLDPASGLPSPGDFDHVQLAVCPANTDRVYAMFSSGETAKGLFRSRLDGTWQLIQTTGLPHPFQGDRCYDMVVAPNSPGIAEDDILLVASQGAARSVDSGRTWKGEKFGFHVDQHAIGFGPVTNGIPLTYLGSDGGLGGGADMADRNAQYDFPFENNTDLNQGETEAVTGALRNLNHGKQALALTGFACNASLPTLTYTSTMDTGVQAGSGTLGWRGLVDDDVSAVAIGPRPDGGVTVWYPRGILPGWPGIRARRSIDRGNFIDSTIDIRVTATGSRFEVTAQGLGTMDGEWIVAGTTRDPQTRTQVAVTAGSDRTVEVVSLENFRVDHQVIVGVTPAGGGERVRVKSIDAAANTFVADFGSNHAADVEVAVENMAVYRVDRDGQARRLSQSFGDFSRSVRHLVASPVNPDLLCCSTFGGDRLFVTDGDPIGAPANWAEITDGSPGGNFSGFAFGPTNKLHVFTDTSRTTGAGATEIRGPLFQIEEGRWIHKACLDHPLSLPFGDLIADPLNEDVMYGTAGGSVFRLDYMKDVDVWKWTAIGDGLPGNVIVRLWIGNIAPADRDPLIVLRAACLNRGVWEADVSPGAQDRTPDLYVRDHAADSGRIRPSPEGLDDPYRVNTQLWHYQCADIKLDVPSRTGAGERYFQTGNDGQALPIDHTRFDALDDNSQAVVTGDVVLLHVQAHNRSHTPAEAKVWAIWTPAGAGLPALDQRTNGETFDFWGQFDDTTGTITPNLPADSAWKSVGAPVPVSGIDAAHPQVASWRWQPPTIGADESGHFCVVTFIQSRDQPIDRSSVSPDWTTMINAQVGQKNLHLLPPIDTSSSGGSDGGSGTGGGGNPITDFIDWVTSLIRFNNPEGSERGATVVVDARGLPPAFRVSLRLRTKTSSTGGMPALRLTAVLGWLIQSILALVRFIVGFVLRVIGIGTAAPLRVDKAGWTDFRIVPPSGRIEVETGSIPARGYVLGEIKIDVHGRVEANRSYHFEVQQRVKDKLIGGSTYVVRTTGPRKPAPIETEDEGDKESRRLRENLPVPPWIAPLLRRRLREYDS